MHEQAKKFLNYVSLQLPSYFMNTKILDVGSADINGNNRYLFNGNYDYVGNDVIKHNNVDIVCETGKLTLPDNTFDIIISSECFEHDMNYQSSIKNIIRMLKPNGLFTFTCASTGRKEHGTIINNPKDSLTTQLKVDDWKSYYKNLTAADIKEVINIDEIFSYAKFYYNDISHDLYFLGIKKGDNNNIINILDYEDKGVIATN